MSYNVLADSHARAHPELYRGKDDALLTWPRRLRGILAEVRRLSPDVLCLQECEDFEGVARGLAADGYVGIHAPRSGDKPDGSSLFYRSDKFALESSETIDFERVGLKNNAAAVACLRPVADAGARRRRPSSWDAFTSCSTRSAAIINSARYECSSNAWRRTARWRRVVWRRSGDPPPPSPRREASRR